MLPIARDGGIGSGDGEMTGDPGIDLSATCDDVRRRCIGGDAGRLDERSDGSDTDAGMDVDVEGYVSEIVEPEW